MVIYEKLTLDRECEWDCNQGTCGWYQHSEGEDIQDFKMNLHFQIIGFFGILILIDDIGADQIYDKKIYQQL